MKGQFNVFISRASVIYISSYFSLSQLHFQTNEAEPKKKVNNFILTIYITFECWKNEIEFKRNAKTDEKKNDLMKSEHAPNDTS